MDRMHSTKKVYISKTFLDQKRSQYLLVNSTIIHPTITITTLLSPLQLKQIIKMYKKKFPLHRTVLHRPAKVQVQAHATRSEL